MSKSPSTWKSELADLGLMLLSISLWAVAGWTALNGWIANFGEGDVKLLLVSLVLAAAGWWAWPGDKTPRKTDPWSL